MRQSFNRFGPPCPPKKYHLQVVIMRLALVISAIFSVASGVPATGELPGKVWQPKIAEKYQMILTGVIDPKVGTVQPDVPIYDIDLFYHPKSTIDWLHSQGKKVICYIDVGSAEDWYVFDGHGSPSSLSDLSSGVLIMETSLLQTKGLAISAGRVSAG